MLTLLRHRPFLFQFSANGLSMIGTALTPVALALGVLEATGSAAKLGLVLAAYSVPQVVFLLAGGVWADRLPRQRMMVAADAIRVFTQCGFGVLLLTGWSPLWAMMALQALCGAGSALFLPASTGLVADTTPVGMRQEANALLSLTRNLTGTIGPIVAASVVLGLGAGWALVLDGASFFGSLVFLALLRLPPVDRAKEMPGRSFVGEVIGGFDVVRRTSWIWTTIVYCMFFNIGFSAFQVLGPAIVVARDHGAVVWGVTVALLGLGQIVGNAAALMWFPRRPLLTGRLVMFAGAPVLFLLSADGSPLGIGIGALLLGLAISFPDTLWDAALQEHVRPDALARVSSVDYFGSFILRPVGLAVSGVVAGAVGLSATLMGAGVLIVVATAVSLLDPGVSKLTRALPTPDGVPTLSDQAT
ncbi:MFS transporter [Nocardioides bruguierae]|uniref:MFS transporter n=1 Tax=Nocardioides bruguierae TaxID=2945102 RepID=A0A9X2IG82_9ACTN|nr:MFS transporter [Nocardioides bruguierae]MCM0622626.1 MFS transporter [Nocardioides bruguierae]